MFTIELNNREYRVKFWHGNSTTEAWIVDEESKVPFAIGHADLHPSDPYVKAIGRKLALTRALNEFTESREERREVWNKYWSMTSTAKLKVPGVNV
jgi:hypothetical protein